MNKRAASPAPIPIASPDPDPVPGALAPNYLINVTVGEDWAYCRSCPNPKCKWVERYPFNASVILQCLVDPSEATNNTYWALSTDWCYVRNEDFWESMTGDCECSNNFLFRCCRCCLLLPLLAMSFFRCRAEKDEEG